jgi:glycosyltransferase involved in cell wall biosynthesis
MVIAVNTRFLIKDKLEGIGWFTYESLKRIVEKNSQHQFHFLFDRPYDSSFVFGKNVTPHVIPPPARHPLLWYLWFEYSVPSRLKKIHPDIFLSTDGYASLSTDVPQVIVIHDLAFEHYPGHIDLITRAYYKYYVPKFARKAARIATVSEFSKQDIVKRYNVDANKIDVVYNGAHEAFKPLDANEIALIRKRYSGNAPYFIYAGAVQPRKNVDNLFKAFDRFKSENNLPHKLVIVGRFAWKTGPVREAYNDLVHKDQVVFTGHLGRAELAQLIGAANALVYVSLFEGFGIPIVEAFQCRVPVITSHVSSMPEVAGDGALLVNPNDVNEISSAMKRIATDIQLRNDLVEAGQRQLQKFSWELTAEKLWQSVLKAK